MTDDFFGDMDKDKEEQEITFGAMADIICRKKGWDRNKFQLVFAIVTLVSFLSAVFISVCALYLMWNCVLVTCLKMVPPIAFRFFALATVLFMVAYHVFQKMIDGAVNTYINDLIEDED